MKEHHAMLELYNSERNDSGLIALGGILDRQHLLGPIAKERIEDLQLWSALKALAVNGAILHPLSVQLGGDPPDRLLSHADSTWGLELTELTIEDVRGDLARVRRFGRQMRQRLRGQPKFQHLRGRVVMLSKRPEDQLPRDLDQLASELETALSEDKGYFDGSNDQQGSLKGWYGICNLFTVLVNKAGGDDEVQVNAVSHSELMRQDVLQGFERRVMNKDRPGNDLIIITCGLPDKQGYVCSYDHAIFMMLRNTIAEGGKLPSRTPTHIRGGLIHLWDTDMLITWSEDNESLPWAST